MATKGRGMTPEQAWAYTGKLNEFIRFKATAHERVPFAKVEDAFHLYLIGRYNDAERYAIIEANRLEIRLFQAEIDAGAGREIWPPES